MHNQSLNRYVTVQRDADGLFYAVHMGGKLFYCGEDDNGTPIWSDQLQDCAIYCRESAEIICAEYPTATFDPISVDLHIVA